MKVIGIVVLAVAVTIIAIQYLSKNNRSDRLNSQGLMYLNESKYDKALVEFKKALEAEKRGWQKEVMHLRNIGLAYGGLHDLEAVLQIKKEALKLCPDNSYEFFVTKGDMDLLEGRIQSAIDNFKAAIKLNPDKLEANNSLGLIYLGDYGIEFENLQEALEYNHKALAVYPFSITKSVLGRNYFLLKNYESAKKYFFEILNEYPEDIDAMYYLGLTNYYLRDRKPTKYLLSKVYKYNPNYFDLRDEILVDLNIEL